MNMIFVVMVAQYEAGQVHCVDVETWFEDEGKAEKYAKDIETIHQSRYKYEAVAYVVAVERGEE
jgi:hypothetical protein